MEATAVSASRAPSPSTAARLSLLVSTPAAPVAAAAAAPGNPGTAASTVLGTITENEDAQESNDGSTWTAISGTTSAKRYVKVAHLHNFTYSADATASVEYTIAKADPTAVAPTASATYGQTLADVTLENLSGNTPGTWAWVDDSQSVGNAGTEAKNFKANFTPTDAANYNPEGYDAAKAACVTM